MREVIIILGRSHSLNFSLKKKLPISYLDILPDEVPLQQEEELESLLYNFLSEEIKTNRRSIYELKETGSRGIYFVEAEAALEYKKDNRIGVLSFILRTLNELKLLNYKDDKIIYLCHDAHFGEKRRTEKKIDGNEMQVVIEKLDFFLDDKFATDKVFIATFFHEDPNSKVFTALKAANLNNWKGFDIKTLLEKFDSDLLEEQKKKLINTFLPLAIDIQGLSEIIPDKRAEYLRDVLSDLEQNADAIIKDWHNISEKLFSKTEKISLVDKFKFTQKELEKFKFPIYDQSKELTKKSLKDFVKVNYLNPKSDTFLPNWLQHSVSVIDDKLKNSKNVNLDSE